LRHPPEKDKANQTAAVHEENEAINFNERAQIKFYHKSTRLGYLTTAEFTFN